MAKRKTGSKNIFSQLLGQNTLKVILAVVASGSFAIAFGQKKISQWISLPASSSSSSACATQFYKEIPPFISKESVNKNTYPLCFNGFNVMYSGVSKTPLWVAESLTPKRLSQKIPREDSFHEEMKVPSAYRATLADYRASGYDRGHMAPNADMSNKAAQADSFSLANMVPQAPKNNQKVWRELEEATRAIVTKQKHDVYVVTGPTFTGKKLKTIGNNKVIVPTAVFKAIYIPKTGAIGAYYAPNDNSLNVKVVSICYLEEQLGMNIFPQLTEEQKRNTYNLPLKANAVKANQEISYSHWDAQSQCAEDVSEDKLLALKKQFKSDSLSEKNVNISSSNSSSVDPDTQDAIVKHLIEALVQYILQLLR